MKDKASRTAADVVALRALSSIAPSGKRIMVDELSLKMLPWPWHWAEPLFSLPALKPFTYRLGRAISNTLTGYRGTIELVALRYRHIDDRLEAAYRSGIRQVVLLGAGYDFRAHRKEYPDVHFIEIDHPKTQEGKLDLLKRHRTRVNGEVRYLAVDFHEDWVRRVEESRMLRPEPAFIIWEGVSYYLREEAVRYTLKALKTLFVDGSRLIFDCVPPAKANGHIPSRELILTAKYVAKKGEPLLWGGTDAQIREMLAGKGYGDPDVWSLSQVAARLRSHEGVGIAPERIYDEFYLVEAEI
ncbi:S-adenosyl-L-methionine-dependent methyltransferase [Geomonas sp. Red276]